MSFKTLLVHVENTPESDLRLRAAVDLARSLRAQLIGVGGCLPAYLENLYLGNAYPMYTDGLAVQEVANQEALDLKSAESRFRDLAAALGEASVWRSGDDCPDRIVESFAAGADLILASASRGSNASTINPGEMALTTGIPVMVIPMDVMGLRCSRIVIAWKDTREARRAVTDALPMLKEAEQVMVVEVTSEAEPNVGSRSLEFLLGRLARQGIAARADSVRSSGGVAHELIGFAEENLADLIVAGAYGHSRLREWSFGGVTNGLLKLSTLPVLFSH